MKKWLRRALLFAALACLLVTVAYAHPASHPGAGGEKTRVEQMGMITSGGQIATSKADGGTSFSRDWDMGEFGEAVEGLYSTFQKISIPIGAVALAYCAFSAFLGSEKEIEMAKAHGKLIIMAVIAIIALPLVMKFAMEVMSGYQWDPANP